MHREDLRVSIGTRVPVFTCPHTPAETFNVCKHKHGAFLSLEAEWFPGSTHKPLLDAGVLVVAGTSYFAMKIRYWHTDQSTLSSH